MIEVERNMDDIFHLKFIAKPTGYVTAEEVIETIVATLDGEVLNSECYCKDGENAIKDVIAFVKTFQKDANNG